MHDRRPGIVIWLNPCVVPLPKPAGPAKRHWYATMDTFASEFTSPTRMGDHKYLEAGKALAEKDLKWKWVR